LLDSGPLGIVTNPKAASPLSQEGKVWLQSLPLKGYIVMLPEIADYEVRRELIRVVKRQVLNDSINLNRKSPTVL